MKHLNTKIQEVTCHHCENEKLYQTTYMDTRRNPRDIIRQSYIPDSDIDSFTDKPVVKCDVQVVEYTLVDDSK